VSCGSAGNCTAGGYYTATETEAFVVDEVNGTWGTAIEINTAGYAQVTSVSCASAGNCSAGGYDLNGSFLVSEVNGTWGPATEEAVIFQITSVSCGSAGNCTAGGYGGTGQLPEAIVVSQVNGTWGTPVQVPGTAALAVDSSGDARVNTVSCSSAGNCSAGGYYYDGSGDQQAFVVSQVDGSWGMAIEVPGTAALNAPISGAYSEAGIVSVSCASAGNCSAGGYYEGFGERVFVVSQVNGTWGTAIELPGVAALSAYDTQISSVSCASAGNCTVGGVYNTTQGFVLSQVNGTWGAAEEVFAPVDDGSSAPVVSLSCVPPGDCAAGGYYADSSGQQGFVADYAALPLDATETTLAESGGGASAGTPVVFTATVADSTAPADTPEGTVSLYDNGSTTPLLTAALTGGTATVSYTYAAAGAHSVLATYNPPAGLPWSGSSSAPVTFTETAPACASCNDLQTVEGTVPAGTLAISTPYTPSNPLNFGTLSMTGNGTFFTASWDLAFPQVGGKTPPPGFGGITVVDTQAGDLPWTVTALASNLGDGGTNPGSTISGEDVGLSDLLAVPVYGNALTAGDLTLHDQPAADPPVGPADTGTQGLGGGAPHTIANDFEQADGTIGITGIITLNAPTSTEAGVFTGTITFTIAS
jgi:hypothetical protein